MLGWVGVKLFCVCSACENVKTLSYYVIVCEILQRVKM